MYSNEVAQIMYRADNVAHESRAMRTATEQNMGYSTLLQQKDYLNRLVSDTVLGGKTSITSINPNIIGNPNTIGYDASSKLVEELLLKNCYQC